MGHASRSLTPDEADGLRAAFVLVLEGDDEDEHDELIEIRGILRWDGRHLTLEHDDGVVSIPRAGLTRLRRPHADSAAAAYCDVFIALSANALAGDSVDGSDPSLN